MAELGLSYLPGVCYVGWLFGCMTNDGQMFDMWLTWSRDS
jgi:hypothetical protein